VVFYGRVLARLRSGTYQDLGGTRWIVVATHSLVCSSAINSRFRAFTWLGFKHLVESETFQAVRFHLSE
jgi:hypothetical protein